MENQVLMGQKNLRWWELALLLGLAFAALLGGWLSGQQAALAEKVIRLHVIANSDTPEDQALKLQVRDRILEEAALCLDPQGGVDGAEEDLRASLERLSAAGQEVVAAEGLDYQVTASLEETWFPTKQYTDFALPAGNYTALRIVIGQGGGQNWWCVVFPPLCLGSVTETVEETAYAGGFSQEEVSLITGESEGYVVKFKAMELWEELKASFS